MKDTSISPRDKVQIKKKGGKFCHKSGDDSKANTNKLVNSAYEAEDLDSRNSLIQDEG